MVERAVQRLKIHLLVRLIRWLVPVDHPHLHICQVQTGTVQLIVLVHNSSCLVLVPPSLWRMTHFVPLPLFLLFVLSNQTLVSSSVVVIREKLGQKQVHVWSILPCSCPSTSITVSRLLRAACIRQLRKVLNIYVVGIRFRIVLHTSTLLVDEVSHAVLAL